MFNNYEIKNIRNEEVLILYIDLNTELGTLNKKDKTTINKEIKEYVKENKINFKGKKIILMAGSLLIGTLLFTTPLLNKEVSTPSYNYSTNIISKSEGIASDKEIAKEEIKEQVQEETKEDANEVSKENQKAPAKTGTSQTTSSSKNNTSTKNPTSNKPVETPVTPPKETITTPKAEDKKEESNQIASETNKKMVTIKRSNGTTVTLELEEYIIGVVSAEMPASFHSEALKAQAIAARTYALKTIESGKTLTDTVSTQVYQDNTELKNKWGSSYNTYYNKVKNAVLATEGLVMTYNGELINAYYHSTSNGYTEDSTAVFGAYPYLKSVESPVDKNVSSYLKTISISYEDISNRLGIPVTSLSNIKVERNSSNRVDKIIINDNIYGGVEFRTKLGLRSTDFDLNLYENNISITTRGYGHGVGMSQYGAHEYAKSGLNYSQILKHYYTGITIKKY